MGFWAFTLVTDLIVPVLVLLFGIHYGKNGAPKSIEGHSGFRSRRATKSWDAWVFTHKLAAKIWRLAGIIMLPVTALMMIFAIGFSVEMLAFYGSLIFAFQGFAFVGTIIYVESQIKKNFNDYGVRTPESIEKEQKEEEKKAAKEAKNSKKKRIIKTVIIVLVSIGVLSGSVAGVYVNNLLDKVNFEDEVVMSVDPDIEAEEELDFSIDEKEDSPTVEPPTAAKPDKIPDKTRPQVTKKPTTTKKHNTSNSLVSIQKVENGVEKEYQVSEDKLKQEAAVIQQQADKDIEQNLEKDTSIWYSADVYNLLIIGYDAGEQEAVMFDGMQYPRSDSMIIASINKKKETIKLVSLSRATYVAIDGYGNKRLNTAHAFGGAKKLIETIENNYKIKIDNYMSVDFKGFSKIIDAMDGVSVDMSAIEANFAFNREDLKAGNYTLNGKQALKFVRLRQTDSDRQRTGRQRKVLKSIFDKFKTQTLAQELEFMETVLPYVTTDMAKGMLVKRITEAQSYLDFKMTEDIIPHNAIKLTLKEGKEVIILDWDETTSYIHKILYDGADVKKIEKA